MDQVTQALHEIERLVHEMQRCARLDHYAGACAAQILEQCHFAAAVLTRCGDEGK